MLAAAGLQSHIGARYGQTVRHELLADWATKLAKDGLEAGDLKRLRELYPEAGLFCWILADRRWAKELTADWVRAMRREAKRAVVILDKPQESTPVASILDGIMMGYPAAAGLTA